MPLGSQDPSQIVRLAIDELNRQLLAQNGRRPRQTERLNSYRRVCQIKGALVSF
jgi:hypothetical protein